MSVVNSSYWASVRGGTAASYRVPSRAPAAPF